MTPKQREQLWDQEVEKALVTGRGDCPICNLCDTPVQIGQPWDESHIGAPAALGGDTVGIAHRKCNRDHGAKVVTPFVAKAKRMRRRHIGVRKARTMTRWRRFNGELVIADRER